MKIMLLSANFGEFDTVQPSVQQDIRIDSYIFTSQDYPPRVNMSPRLQARIPKMFGWDMRPGADLYIWMDASYRLKRSDTVRWLLKTMDDCDFAIHRHPERTSIREEAEHIEDKILQGSRYLRRRYAGEDTVGQLKAVAGDGYVDDHLFATMFFAYKPTEKVKQLMADWWVHTSRFHAVDQLALPYLLWDHGCSVAVLEGDPYHSKWIEYVRGKRA